MKRIFPIFVAKKCMMVNNNESILSKTISFLRFPLIVAVVFIHVGFENVMINGVLLVQKEQFPIYDVVNHIVKNELAGIAVPLFFFISGFLFFYNSNFSLHVYGEKLKKRVRSLLIPYVFWNVLVFTLFLIAQLFLSSLISGRNKMIMDYNWLDWLDVFWSCIDGMPICYQFWFIRDLMIVVIFTPLIYYFIKYCKILGIVAIGVFWLFNLLPSIPGFSTMSFFFFSFGAWFSVNKHNFITYFSPIRLAATFVYLVLLILNVWLDSKDFYYLHNIGIIVGLIAVVSWVSYGVSKECLRNNDLLTGSSFFVYAYHGIPLAFVVKYWMQHSLPLSEEVMLTGYFLIPSFVVALGVGIYALLRKCLPNFTNVITGGR